jgi:PAP2 superfamily
MTEMTNQPISMPMGRAVAVTGSKSELLWLAPLSVMFILLTGTAEILSQMNGTSALGMIDRYIWKALRVLPVMLGVALIFQVALAFMRDYRNAADNIIAQWRGWFSDPYIVAAMLAPVAMMPFFFCSFSVLKMLIPVYVPFWLDEYFVAADKFLFFGTNPWELTHAVFGSFSATATIDLMYLLWVFMLSAAIGGFAFFAPRKDRARFFLAFGGAWFFLGFIGAWIGSSAGPFFLSYLNSPSAPEFAALVEKLRNANIATGGRVNAPFLQDILIQGYLSKDYHFGLGISAMPSLHNAISVLYVFAAFRIGKLIGWTMVAYAIVIFIGSVHLAWHYAVDGIVATFGMWGIWRAVNWWCAASGYDASVDAETNAKAITA